MRHLSLKQQTYRWIDAYKSFDDVKTAGSAESRNSRSAVAGDSRGGMMLDLFYIGVVVAFFVLLWGFTKFSEHM